MFCVFWKLFYIFLVYTPVKVKFLISQPVRCTQALRMQWWLQICHQENQERQSTIIVRTIWNRLEALISSSTGGSGANIWFLEGKRYFDRLVFKNEMTPAFLGASVPENRTKVFPMQEFQQHHSNNQMQGQWGCIKIFFLALKKWWAMMFQKRENMFNASRDRSEVCSQTSPRAIGQEETIQVKSLLRISILHKRPIIYTKKNHMRM